MGPYEICAQLESFVGAAVHKIENNGSNQKWVFKSGSPIRKTGKKDNKKNLKKNSYVSLCGKSEQFSLMKIKILLTEKTNQEYLINGMNEYIRRLKPYGSLEIITINTPKKWNSLPAGKRMEKEGELLMNHIDKGDFCILLDENGKSLTSMGFANFLQEQMNRSVKSLLFIVGGPWGFADEISKKAHMKLSMSSMTFSHQMVRLFFLEQLYRAFTIIRNQPYHNA